MLIYAKAGSGAFGPVYSDMVTTQAHIILGKPIRDQGGSNSSQSAEEIAADVVIYIKPDVTCPVGSKISYGSLNYKVVKATTHSAPGFPTPDHIKLLLAPYGEES